MATNKMTKKQREEVELKIIKAFDILDKSGTNSNYYKELFASMNDDQFYKWMQRKFPIRMQMRTSVTEPSNSDVKEALDFIGVPMMEKVNLNYLYKNSDGIPVQSQDALIVYTHLKKVQQFITKKNKYGVEIGNRDGRTGRLVGDDKGAVTSDREFESFAALGLDASMDEFSGPRADAMDAKNVMYNMISTTGQVYQKDLPQYQADSLSKNLMNVYLTGALISSNLINEDNYTAHTLRKNKNIITRS